jgi:hypothetical protein
MALPSSHYLPLLWCTHWSWCLWGALRCIPVPGRGTTHFVIVDRHRNVVSITTTIESNLGSSVVVPGRGFLLNNELTDFDASATDSDGECARLKRDAQSAACECVCSYHQLAVLHPVLHPVRREDGRTGCGSGPILLLLCAVPPPAA